MNCLWSAGPNAENFAFVDLDNEVVSGNRRCLVEEPATDSMPVGINLYMADLFGSKLIAVPALHSTFHAFSPDTIEVIMTGRCGSYQGQYISMMPFLRGSVEYDRRMKFSTVCEQGSLKYFFEEIPPGKEESRQVELNCTLKE